MKPRASTPSTRSILAVDGRRRPARRRRRRRPPGRCSSGVMSLKVDARLGPVGDVADRALAAARRVVAIERPARRQRRLPFLRGRGGIAPGGVAPVAPAASAARAAPSAPAVDPAPVTAASRAGAGLGGRLGGVGLVVGRRASDGSALGRRGDPARLEALAQRPVAGLALLEAHHDRRGHEDRRVGARRSCRRAGRWRTPRG